MLVTTGFGLKAAMRLGTRLQSKGSLRTHQRQHWCWSVQGKYSRRFFWITTIYNSKLSSFSTTDDTGGGGIDFASGTEALLVGVFNGASS